MPGTIRFTHFVLLVCLFASKNVYAQTNTWNTYLVGPGASSASLYNLATYDNGLYAYGSFDGGSLAKLSNNGDLQWIQRSPIAAWEMTADENNLYIVGNPTNATNVEQVPGLSKLGHDGQTAWSYQESVPGHFSGIATDHNSIYVSGITYIYPESVLLRKLDSNGDLVWSKDLEVNIAFNNGAMAVAANQIFLKAGFNNLAIFDTDGNYIADVPTSADIISLAYYDNYLYASGQIRDSSGNQILGYNLSKLDLEGQLVWEREFNPSAGGVGQILVRDDGIYLSAKKEDGASGSLILHYDLDGLKLWEHPFPDLNLPSPAPPIAFSGDELVIGGKERTRAYIGSFALHGQVSTKNNIVTLGDINTDGLQEIALLTSTIEDTTTAPATIKIKSASTTEDLLGTFQLESIHDIADAQVISDLNGNSSPELVLVDASKLDIEIRDSLTGELLNQLRSNSNFKPLRMKLIANLIDSNDSIIAVLGQREDGSWPHVKLFSASSLQLMGNISYHPDYAPLDLLVLTDVDGESNPGLAVLSVDDNTLQSKIEIRSLTGNLIKNSWLGNAFDSTAFVTSTSIFSNTNGALTEIAVLQKKRSGDGKRIAIIDVFSGEFERAVGYNWQYNSKDAKAISDIDGNGENEFVILGEKATSSGNVSQPAKVEVRDSSTGALVANVWQGMDMVAQDLDIMPDINGNSTPEICTLMQNGDELLIYIKDSMTGEAISTVNF